MACNCSGTASDRPLSRAGILDLLKGPETEAFRDEKPVWSEHAIDTPAEMSGGSLFVGLPNGGTALVELADFALLRDPDGHVVIGRLAGKVVWQDARAGGAYTEAKIDRMAMLDVGFSRVERLDDLLFRFGDADWRFMFESIRLRKLGAGGHTLLALESLSGHDLINGTEHSVSGKGLAAGPLGVASCVAVPKVVCADGGYYLRCPSGCVSGNPPVIGDCFCPGTQWWNDPCFWQIAGMSCVNVSCLHRCLQLWGWGGCMCFLGFP